MDELRLVGPFHVHSGYSKLARALLRTALLAGFKVQAIESDYRVKTTIYDGRRKSVRIFEKWNKHFPPSDFQKAEVEEAIKTKVKPEAPTLFVQFPEQLGGWHEFGCGPRIGYTMIESDRLHPSWAKGLYGVDMLAVPSRYVYNTFREQVPEIPIELFPCPVDERLFQPYADSVEIGGRFPEFMFFSVFNRRERKQWRIMMQAFAEEFHEDESVGLVVRPIPSGEVAELAGWLNPTWNHPRRIIVLKDWMSDESLAAWYKRCDCFVLPSCEGFGLPYVEAALCGRPSIALDDGGAFDVVTPETGWRIRSERRQVLGNLPHIYTSEHKFAVPESFEEVRRVMRLAYESKEDKGRVARFKAEHQFIPDALTTKLRQVVEQSKEVYRGRTRIWNLSTSPKWGLIVGDGYGDAIACLGNAESVLKASDRIRFLHYGFNKGLKTFLELQPAVAEVRQIVPPDKDTAREVGNEVGGYYAYPKEKWLPGLLRGTGIDPKDVAQTQVHWPWGTWPVNRPSQIRLTDEAEKWAEHKRAELGEYILVQPFSTNSVDLQAHWPYWIPFLRWLIQATESTHLLVFCGQNKIPGLKASNVVDLIGETETMMHVFALADRAKAVITTCNALGVWTACRGTKALIAGNDAIPRKDSFWTRFQTTPNNTLMLVDTPLAKFQKTAERWLGGLSK